jgi:hypothetical protein
VGLVLDYKPVGLVRQMLTAIPDLHILESGRFFWSFEPETRKCIMANIRRILRTIVATLSVAAVVGMTLPAQAQSGRPGMKKFSLKKTGPKAGAGSKMQPFQGTRAPTGSSGMMSGSGGMSSQSKTTNRSGTSTMNRTPSRAKR